MGKENSGLRSKPSIEKYRKLYGAESSVRHEARMEIIAEVMEKYFNISDEAFKRYMEGKDVERIGKGDEIIKLKDMDTADGRLFMETMKAMREMLGVDAPAKTAFTDPTGEKQYEGISDSELMKMFVQIQDNMNVGKDTDG